ncbi:carbohydrate ABC transporter permease [Eubacteriales bacterium OttesenSCG-928-A19]|nr:carbohydrate ABC transporter permease [Eubacteriales bacterium OttesenSCG-928-A19]
MFPFYWVVTGSLKSRKATLMLPPQWFPTEPTLANYETLFKNPALTWFLNSLIIALVSMAIVCVIASLAGYVLAKKRFIGQRVVFGLFVAAMALPKQVILVPLVRLMSGWGLHDTLWAVIFGSIGWPFGIFLMKQFSETIPGELLEAARIDGCGELRTFVTIVVPLVKSGVAALAIFTFITTWNDYFLQLIMLNKRTNLTLQLGIATLQTEFSTNYGVLCAGATFAALPIIIVFICFQKYFTQGITMGAVKG